MGKRLTKSEAKQLLDDKRRSEQDLSARLAAALDKQEGVEAPPQQDRKKP